MASGDSVEEVKCRRLSASREQPENVVWPKYHLGMAARFTDPEIASLIDEAKSSNRDLGTLLRMKEKRGHWEAEADLLGARGNEFRIIIRQSSHNALDFSVILGLFPQGSSQLFRLLRHNGKHHHMNKLEGQGFLDFHIHRATERYQLSGWREDSYAEVTDRYSDLRGALNLLIEMANIELPLDPQGELF